MPQSVTLINDVEWQTASHLIDYPDALLAMEARASGIADSRAAEHVWLIEHPPLYTAGTSADVSELLDARFPVFSAGRGGRYTYHGPGQRIGYVMLNLAKRGRDVRNYVYALEGWVIAALARLDIEAWRAPGRIGIWTFDQGREAKIGAIGVRIRRWVTFHGFSINLDPDLSHFDGIIPCGLPEFAVTSIRALGHHADMAALDSALLVTFPSFLAELSPSKDFS